MPIVPIEFSDPFASVRHARRFQVIGHVTLCIPLLVLAGPVSADLPESRSRRNLTPEDVLSITWCVAPQVSPDGSHVLFVVHEPTPAERRSSVWLSQTKEGALPRQILEEARGVSHLRWSPNGKQLAFLAMHDNEALGTQLFVSSADGNNKRRLTSMPNGVLDFRWSFDSSMLAFTADERARQPTRVRVVGRDAPRSPLWTIGPSDSRPRRVSTDEQPIVDFAWSPDGAHFAVLMADAVPGDDVILLTRLVVLRRSDGQRVRVLADRATGGCDIAWSPDGQTIVAAVHTPRMLSRRLSLIPADGGEPRFPFANFDATPIGRVAWSADSRQLFVRFVEKSRNQLIRLDVDSGIWSRVSEELTNFWGFGVDRSGTTLAFNAESQHDPPDIVVQRGGRRWPLTNFNTHLEAFRLGRVTTIDWKSSLDDRTIYGVLITPPDWDRNEPVPTIVNLHSGPHWLWWEGWIGTYMSWGQLLASNGYAVLLPNHRGSIGQGWRFAEAHYREWGRGDYQDVIDGVDLLVRQGIADPQRLGVGGISFGGYLTAWTTTQTQRFRAAVIEAGWTDLISANLTTDAPGPLRVFMGGNELEQRELYRNCSPLTFVQQCTTPTLILHGALDRRVPLDQGRSFYRALQLCDVRSEMVIYEDEGHGMTKRENQLDAMHRMMAWFDRHLKD